jgi:hypothetical protein
MPFQIHALPADIFSDLFSLSDAELAGKSARRIIVDENPGYPCRVSLADAKIGDIVLLVNYQHQPNETPYRASHAVFVRQGVEQASPEPGEIPEALASRLMSVRAFDGAHDMIAADVVDGQALKPAIESLFADPRIDYLHLHNAKQGCFAASVTRA